MTTRFQMLPLFLALSCASPFPLTAPPQISKQSGPVLKNMQLVTMVAENDPLANQLIARRTPSKRSHLAIGW